MYRIFITNLQYSASSFTHILSVKNLDSLKSSKKEDFIDRHE